MTRQQHDDTALSYLYGRYDIARRMMAEDETSAEQRRDWAMRAEELRQCLRRLEQWRVEKVGARYLHDAATSDEIRPPKQGQTRAPTPRADPMPDGETEPRQAAGREIPATGNVTDRVWA